MKLKNVDGDDTAIVAEDDAWPKLSKKLVVWILLCAAYPYRISFIVHLVQDFDQQRRLNDRVGKLKCSSVVVYGATVHDTTMPDIEKMPLAVFYAEYVEPYIYAIKSAEKLLKADGDPDDFVIILGRMLFHEGQDNDDDDELPSILCEDVLGPFMKETMRSEYIIKEASAHEGKLCSAEQSKNSSFVDDNMIEKKSTKKGAISSDGPMKLEVTVKAKERLEYLSLLHYSFNLNPSMRRLISLEMSTITSEHNLFVRTSHSHSEKEHELIDVLVGKNIQSKKEVVTMGRKLHRVTRKIDHDSHNHHDKSYSGDAAMVNDQSVECGRIIAAKSLSELTVVEVGRLLESIQYEEYKAIFTKNKINGKCLMTCKSVEDVINMGISIFVKANLLLVEIMKWKAIGVLTEHVSIDRTVQEQSNVVNDQSAEIGSELDSGRDSNHAKVKNVLEYRKMY